MKKILNFGFLGLLAFLLFSCGKEKSKTTGWKYNDPKWGGFEKHDYKGQETGPGLVFIQGGTFSIGQVESDVERDNSALPRRVTVQSFYMDECEVRNMDYREYTFWLARVFTDAPEVFRQSLPDTNCWRNKLEYEENYVQNYFRHPAFDEYPVVGVSWVQASNYAAWRTDRVNEYIMIRDGYFKPFPTQANENNFNTESYLAGQYEGLVKKKPKSYVPKEKNRKVRLEDGILLPPYRLPTEAEWEFAALAERGDALFENVNTRRIYPWKGLSLRYNHGKYRGKLRADLRRDHGDFMGVPSELNDAAATTTKVKSYWPNDYGLFDMAGNVSEWVADVFRPLSPEDVSGLNPIRGNVYQAPKKDEEGYLLEKDSLGRIQYRDVTVEENINRRNYKKADNIGFLDEEKYESGAEMYDYGVASLVNNKARVYKGGSWEDNPFWQSPGTRRFLDENQGTRGLGFRCAMSHLGGSKNMSKHF